MSWPPLYWSPQGQTINASFSENQRRATAVQIALAVVGLGPGDPRYRELCYPHDDPRIAEQMAGKQSACALVCGGILRCLGFEHAQLGYPYAWRFRKHNVAPIVADAMSRLQIMGSWAADPSRLPLPGEMAIIGTKLGTHAFTCVERSEDVLESVDGGTGKIRVASRKIVRSGGRVGLRDAMGIRWMVGVLRVGEMVATREWCLPP